jgi:hypothetical protein
MPDDVHWHSGIPMHPAVRFRFADVIAELRCIAAMARSADLMDGTEVEAACRRAESLLLMLRRQFMDDVVFSDEAPGARLSG